MSWSQTGRILLTWPAQGGILSRQLDLNLVNRFASSMGAQLGLVTHDPEVRFYAQLMGIPVFCNIHRAKDQAWKVSPVAKKVLLRNIQHHNLENIRSHSLPLGSNWMNDPIIRFICLGISVLALLVLGVFILPSAEIVLFPRLEIQSMRFDLSADPSSTTANPSTGHLPTYSKEVLVEGSDTITTTGSMIIPDDPAQGDLKFTNLSKQAINISAGTIVSTQSSVPVRFITISLSGVTIYPNKSVVVPARAIKPGSSGNLPPNKLVIIDGDPGRDLMVTNPDATHGGTDVTFPAPTAQDIQILHDRLLSQLKGAALIELQTGLSVDDTLISPTLSIIETLEDAAIPSIGEPGNKLELTMRLRFQSQVVSGEVLRSLVTPILNSNTPVGYTPLINSLKTTQVNRPSLGQDGIAHWTISAVRKLRVVIQPYQVVDLVKGATVAKAEQCLSASLPLMERAQITLTPPWWPRLPFLTMHIQVTQEELP